MRNTKKPKPPHAGSEKPFAMYTVHAHVSVFSRCMLPCTMQDGVQGSATAGRGPPRPPASRVVGRARAPLCACRAP